MRIPADDAVGRVEEAEFLLFHGVGRMVGGQQIDRASATAAMVAWRSASERSGGFILAKVPYLSSASSFNAM